MATFTPVKLLIDTITDSQVSISNTAGGQTWLPTATSTTAGMIEAADKVKLNNLTADLSAKEDKVNKATNLLTPDDVKYPTTKAVSDAIAASNQIADGVSIKGTGYGVTPFAVDFATPAQTIAGVDASKAINSADLKAVTDTILPKDVVSAAIVGNNLVQTRQDGTTITTDVTALLADIKLQSGVYNSTTKAIDFTLSDNSTISVPVSQLLPVNTAKSITGNGSTTTVELVGDSATPGNNKFYGTDAAGVKGWNGQLPVTHDNTLAGDGATIQLSVPLSVDANNSLALGSDGRLFTQSAIITNYSAIVNGSSGAYTGTPTQPYSPAVIAYQANFLYRLTFILTPPNDLVKTLDLGFGAKNLKTQSYNSSTNEVLANQITDLKEYLVIYNIYLDEFLLIDPTSNIVSVSEQATASPNYVVPYTVFMTIPFDGQMIEVKFDTTSQGSDTLDVGFGPSPILFTNIANLNKAIQEGMIQKATRYIFVWNSLELAWNIMNYSTAPAPTNTSELTNDSDFTTNAALNTGLATKQNTLVSGTNIKTVNSTSLLGSGNLLIDKTSIGLANVDNTSDLNKPISTAQATVNTAQTATNTDQTTTNANTVTALGLKQDKTSFAVPSIVLGNATTTQKILITDQASTATNAINVDALFATTPLKNATGQIIMTAGNVRYGTTVPSVIAGTDNKNDTYIQNSTGAFGGVLTNTFVFDGSNWVTQTNSGVLSVGVEAGSTTNTGTAINPVIGLATVGTAGTYNQVTTDTKGRVATAINVAAVNSVLAVGTTPNANGATIAGTGSSTTLQLQPANATNPGILTATNWNTFNNKLASIATSTGTTGLTLTPTTTAGAVTQALTGTLSTANGGTGLTGVGTAGQVLTSNGTTLSYTTPANNDFFRSGTGTTLPDGTADTTEKVSRIGQTGFGVVDTSTVGATIDNFGTLTTRSSTISNAVATLSITAAQVDANSTLKVIQTVVDTVVTIASPVTSTAAGRYLRLHNDNTSTSNLIYNGIFITPGTFADLQWNGNVWAREARDQSGSIIAKTPYNAAPESVVAFDGMEIKWHNSSATSYDGIALRVTSGSRSLRYTAVEFYLTNAAADGGKLVYGSNNAWNNIPNTGATATIINTVYPYAQTVTTTFLGMGNPALPNADYRQYMLYDDTNKVEYRITVDKQASTGEVLAPQTGTCIIVVEKMGLTTNTILTSGQGVNVNAGTLSLATIPVYATNGAAVADVALLTNSLYYVVVGGFKQVFVK